MIKKILKMNNFGIFHDFTWSEMDDFRTNNLIYGWNYSGKTTLSKLFRILETKGQINYFENPQFLIENSQNEDTVNYSTDNILEFPHTVKVFNSEYISNTFTWDDPRTDIEPISFYLGEQSGNIKSEITRLEEKNNRLETIKSNRYKRNVTIFNNYNKTNGHFSVKAKEIRENYLPKTFQQSELNKSHIQKIVNKTKNAPHNHILSPKELEKYRNEALADNDYNEVDEEIKFTENLRTLSEKVQYILKDTAPKSVSFPDLDNDNELFKWVQNGLRLHENTNKCKFCASTLPKERIKDLNSYYSRKLREIQQHIEEIQSQIRQEYKKIKPSFPDVYKISKPYREEYKEGLTIYNDAHKEYCKQLSILEGDLSKKSHHIFEEISPSLIDLKLYFSKAFEKIESSIINHNAWLSEHEQRKHNAIEKLLNHYVADFTIQDNYLQKENNYISSNKIIHSIEEQISFNNKEIEKLKASLINKVKGKDELNKTLGLLLHRDDIRIEIRNDKFALERSGNFATSLSEGEKSAISFSYFLTELKSLREEEKLKDTIIFIDDPISSLDSNHIFQVRSLIHGFMSKNDFHQIFISTHNFEFFSVMLDTRQFKGSEVHRKPLYFIQRVSKNNSTIKHLPKTFSDHKSEYVGLFHIIKGFHDLDNKEDFSNILILPNAVRRFLELYTLMKYPTKDEIDVRVRNVFNPDDKPYHNTKLLHWFSHQNQLDKVHSHDDKLLQIEGAIEDLLNHIENNDELHWKGLNR